MTAKLYSSTSLLNSLSKEDKKSRTRHECHCAEASCKTVESTSDKHKAQSSPGFDGSPRDRLYALRAKLSRIQSAIFFFMLQPTPLLNSTQRCTSVSVAVKNFLATGSYQKPIGRDWVAPVSQTTASRCTHEVVEALNTLLPTYIRFPTTDQERNKIKRGFYEKFRMPGVLGCIDGTLIAILAPRNHPSEAAFFSRKGYHAINTAIICDSDLRITAVCAKFGGAAHDSYVWRSWQISQFLEDEHNNGKIGWLLGDSGYPQKPWLMTPVLHAAENTPEANYTNMHVHARVCVERCIGLLKARWRCLLRHRVLHYEPTKCAKIINACSVLPNLCLNDGIITIDSIEASESTDESLELPSIESFADERARQRYIQVLWDNRRHL